MDRRAPFSFVLLSAALLLSGCDQLGIETPALLNAKREGEGKAIGGACRHAGRAIEDCYSLNKKGDKAAIFAGWREMNDYMRENKIDAVAPQMVPQTQAKSGEEPDESAAAPAAAEKPKAAGAKGKHS